MGRSIHDDAEPEAEAVPFVSVGCVGSSDTVVDAVEGPEVDVSVSLACETCSVAVADGPCAEGLTLPEAVVEESADREW
jgi:hypothetical protein